MARSERPETEENRVREFVDSLDLLPFGREDAREAGLLAGKLGRRGRMMGVVDVQVAGMAKARRATVLTSDRRFRDLSREIDVEYP